MWEYSAKVLRVIDGDTLQVELDLGFCVKVEVRLRLYGVDTPEVFGVKKGSPEYLEGVESSTFVRTWLASQKKVWVRSYDGGQLRPGKYGRWLAEVFGDDDVCLNTLLVEQGLAEVAVY